ncbi:hypothetical protein [Chitinophaga ginsengisoli]|uniref:Membrane protein DUF2157 n=1 Tax=Chitinophaga ginsengisoli TaxID=363837 RepID=A0A2P8G2W2_9BACT|nr:hypothetical protein [Chitinophaga ginsengisoli]PSL28311.1 hypothetical protein CLV42_108230 [Chitinophaga ginsengisoli]
MIAYNSQSLDNLYIQEQIEMAKGADCITAEEYNAVITAHPVDLYTPNPYMRIGIFILTVVILMFSFGFFCLLSMSGGEGAFTFLCFLFGGGSYGLAEYMVREKRHYKSGADAALIWGAGIFLLSALGIATNGDAPVWVWSFVALLLSVFFVMRFADVSMSVVAHLSFLGLIFSGCEKLGAIAKLVVPFAVMLASAGIYFLSVKLIAVHTYRHYKKCLQMLQVCALITLYLAGNYFVVREVGNEMFRLDLQPGQDIPGGWFFWILTVTLPLIYIYTGIRKKDRILICTGLFLIAGIVYTIRYYHSVAPLEVAMTLGGLMMVGVAYALIRYLKTPRHGFTEASSDEKHAMESLQIESLVIAQTMSHAATPRPDQFELGGGSGGGGGASGDY